MMPPRGFLWMGVGTTQQELKLTGLGSRFVGAEMMVRGERVKELQLELLLATRW